MHTLFVHRFLYIILGNHQGKVLLLQQACYLYLQLRFEQTAHLSCIVGERDSLKFLKRYIKGLDTPQKLSKFVRFISGSELMLFDAIQVHFTNVAGLGRRPIAHTCNTLLELSSTYQSYPELREEFSAILTSDYWEMDIV